MDHMPPTERQRDFIVDRESGMTNLEDNTSLDLFLDANLATNSPNMSCGFASAVGSSECEKGASLTGDMLKVSASLVESIKCLTNNKMEVENIVDVKDSKSSKERRKTMSAKKPPLPPRPTKALSLDAADQNLIRELAKLAMIKRARIERMKALKKMKVSNSRPSTSAGNLLAMIFTIIFCIVIIFQGMCPGRSSSVSFQGSPVSAKTSDPGLISFHYIRNTFATDASISDSGSPRLVE